MLDSLKITATGLDLVPAWFLQLAAPFICSSLAHLINRSLLTSTVPVQWKKACIMPLPKIAHPAGPSEFRPISITSVLSRVIEKSIVRQYIYPCFKPSINSEPSDFTFSDQFAFRPTGSTAAAIISNLHLISTLLITNPFVHVIALDFSKAFDSIRHSTLLKKMSHLSMPDHVYNWIVRFFEGHSQCTKFASALSPLCDISAGVIQGSAIGPASFLVCASDLRPVNQGNHMNKYADDVYLIVPASHSHTCVSELNHVADWAQDNNLKLNTDKSQEMIVMSKRDTGKVKVPKPPPLPNIKRVESMIMLGVKINENLRMTEHIHDKIQQCSKSLFALKTLKSHGMPTAELREIYRATTLSSLLYAAPAWWGFTLAEDRLRIDSFLNRSVKAGYYDSSSPTVEQIVSVAESNLFKAVTSNPNHVLHHLLPMQSTQPYKLRPRPHIYSLPAKTSSLVDKNFFVRVLYRNSY